MASNSEPADENEGYFPIVMKKKVGSSTLASGQTTPGTTRGTSSGKQKILSEGDLKAANEALQNRESFRPMAFLVGRLLNVRFHFTRRRFVCERIQWILVVLTHQYILFHLSSFSHIVFLPFLRLEKNHFSFSSLCL